MEPEAGEGSERLREVTVPTRRKFLSSVPSVAMTAGLIGGYGTFGYVAARFLYPRDEEPTWLFVAEAARIPPGGSYAYRTPAGLPITVTRQGENGEFLALSSTCPHLGCQVHWEPHNNRFFCPCHNGTFDPTGKATGGPPAEAGQSLPRYPLKIVGGLLFIALPQAALRPPRPPAPSPLARARDARTRGGKPSGEVG